jgi:hypothetical protein
MKGTQISNIRRHKRTLAWGPTKPTMGSNKNICNDTRHNVIEHFCVESKVYKICQGWATREGDTTFPTIVKRRSVS